MTDRYVMQEHERIFGKTGSAAVPTKPAPVRPPTPVCVRNLSANSASNCATVLPLPGQNQIRRNLVQRAQHKLAQMRPGMRQDQFRRACGFQHRKRSNPNPAAAARSTLSWAGDQTPVPRPQFSHHRFRRFIFPGARPTTALKNFGEPGGQSTGDVCQREDIKNGRIG